MRHVLVQEDIVSNDYQEALTWFRNKTREIEESNSFKEHEDIIDNCIYCGANVPVGFNMCGGDECYYSSLADVG